MSKEQTPITVKEFYYKWQTQDFKHKKIEIPNFTEEELLNFGEQYAQYRERKAVLEALERKDVKIYTGLRDLNGDRIYRGDVVQNEVEERGVIMYWDGAFCVAYFEEPAKEYLHSLTITDKNYCSTGKVKLTKITKQK